jgi:hypothetical protein
MKFYFYRYSPLSPVDFFAAAAATASYLPAVASATTLSSSTGEFFSKQINNLISE